MEPTLRIKITMTDGTVVEVEEELTKARAFLGDVPKYGYHDGARNYPAATIHTIEIMPPPEPPRFSDN